MIKKTKKNILHIFENNKAKHKQTEKTEMRKARTITITSGSYEKLNEIKKAESEKRGYSVSYAILIAELLSETENKAGKKK